MQAFRFRLERVLAWRKQEQQREEIKLEALHSRMRAVEAELAALPRRCDEAAAALVQSDSVTGADLMRLEQLRQWSVREAARLAQNAAELRKQIAAQEVALNEARRNVKLMERMKERRAATWRQESDKEMETLSGEFAVMEWRRRQERA